MTDEIKKLIESVGVFLTNEVTDYRIQAEWVSKSDFDRVVDELTKWHKVEDKTPLAWESGDWDGKRSDIVIAKDSCGVIYLARVYEGMIDGHKYCDFSDLNDFLLEGITEWKQI